jgi:malate dehydrogenase (oxaloacetate-decarboxylating)(NADP+)
MAARVLLHRRQGGGGGVSAVAAAAGRQGSARWGITATQQQRVRWLSITVEKRFPKPIKVKERGDAILNNSLWNKGMAFDYCERDRLNMRGLLPARVRTFEEQVERQIKIVRSMAPEGAVKQSLYLRDLHNRNETLYHRLVLDHIQEIAPLIYTPTVGDVCQQFGSQFRQTRGMYFSRWDRGMFSAMVYNWPFDDVHIIVVTDGSRILGLGDLGVHGMGIPIGKLALYCAAGGIAPHRVLAVTLDVGTDNEELLNDPDYIGIQERRLDGDEYYDMVDEFMQAVTQRWPGVVVQFEDFATPKAVPLLAKYRHSYRCFNDDIQGTGCVTLAGVLSAARHAGKSLSEMRFVCAGAGSAGMGVCTAIMQGMVMMGGLSEAEARSRFVICTHLGAIGSPAGQGGGGAHGDPHFPEMDADEDRRPWCNATVQDGTSLLETVRSFRPDCLLGLAAAPAIFTEEIVRAMAAHCDTPIIMPMSNPTDKAECTPAQAYEWTGGRAVVATGSPFEAVDGIDGRTFIPSQCNNMYVFPGIGLAASVAGVRRITDQMLYRAAIAVVDCMTAEERAAGRTFPAIERIRLVSVSE